MEEEYREHNKHKPGVLVGNDAAPEFSAETLPPGSAPPDRTFQPNPTNEIPGASHPQTGKETFVSAADTITGATSADVHTGIGKPAADNSSYDRDESSSASKTGTVLANQGDDFERRGLNEKGGQANAGEESVRAEMRSAEDSIPETADAVAAENS